MLATPRKRCPTVQPLSDGELAHRERRNDAVNMLRWFSYALPGQTVALADSTTCTELRKCALVLKGWRLRRFLRCAGLRPPLVRGVLPVRGEAWAACEVRF